MLSFLHTFQEAKMEFDIFTGAQLLQHQVYSLSVGLEQLAVRVLGLGRAQHGGSTEQNQHPSSHFPPNCVRTAVNTLLSLLGQYHLQNKSYMVAAGGKINQTLYQLLDTEQTPGRGN